MLVALAIVVGNSAYEGGNLTGAAVGAALLFGGDLRVWLILLASVCTALAVGTLPSPRAHLGGARCTHGGDVWLVCDSHGAKFRGAGIRSYLSAAIGPMDCACTDWHDHRPA